MYRLPDVGQERNVNRTTPAERTESVCVTPHSTLLWQNHLSVDRLSLLINWISDLPTTVAMVIALCGGGALSGVGLLTNQRLFTHSVRSSHNSVAVYVLGIVSGIYSVLLAFIAVAAWQNFGQAEHLVKTEAHDRVA
jgi:hypothetical protein